MRVWWRTTCALVLQVKWSQSIRTNTSGALWNDFSGKRKTSCCVSLINRYHRCCCVVIIKSSLLMLLLLHLVLSLPCLLPVIVIYWRCVYDRQARFVMSMFCPLILLCCCPHTSCPKISITTVSNASDSVCSSWISTKCRTLHYLNITYCHTQYDIRTLPCVLNVTSLWRQSLFTLRYVQCIGSSSSVPALD